MRLAPVLLTMFVVSASTWANADDFNIEGKELAGLPQQIEQAIQDAEKTPSPCQFVGKQVDLAGNGAVMGYVATTANGCQWGAAMGPIWVVRDGAKPAVVLSRSGYSLTLGKKTQLGLRNIAISAGSAGWYQEELWKFNGKQYISVKRKVVDMSR